MPVDDYQYVPGTNANCQYDVAVNVSEKKLKLNYFEIILTQRKNRLMFDIFSLSLKLQTFLLLTLLSMMNCVVHQVLKILLKITLMVSMCVIFLTIATVESIHLDIFNHERYVIYYSSRVST